MRKAIIAAGCLAAAAGAADKYAADWLSYGAGARALGMGGAYVAVADDATAAYWNPAGLPAIPDQGAVWLKTAFGVGVNSWRGASTVKAPLLPPGRTPTSTQRALPANALPPKSRLTVKRPLATAFVFCGQRISMSKLLQPFQP